MADLEEERKSASEQESSSEVEEDDAAGGTATAQGIDTVLKLAQHTQLDGWRAALGPCTQRTAHRSPECRSANDSHHLAVPTRPLSSR